MGQKDQSESGIITGTVISLNTGISLWISWKVIQRRWEGYYYISYRVGVLLLAVMYRSALSIYIGYSSTQVRFASTGFFRQRKAVSRQVIDLIQMDVSFLIILTQKVETNPPPIGIHNPTDKTKSYLQMISLLHNLGVFIDIPDMCMYVRSV